MVGNILIWQPQGTNSMVGLWSRRISFNPLHVPWGLGPRQVSRTACREYSQSLLKCKHGSNERDGGRRYSEGSLSHSDPLPDRRNESNGRTEPKIYTPTACRTFEEYTGARSRLSPVVGRRKVVRGTKDKSMTTQCERSRNRGDGKTNVVAT